MSAVDRYRLDPRLAADTIALGRTDLAGTPCEVRLMDDARWPWVLLVPAREGVAEWQDLSEDEALALHRASLALGRAMKATAPSHKLNVAMLGNVVRQFHLHHVLRHSEDPAWPGPVWGFGTPVRHEEAQIDEMRRLWTGRLRDLIAP